MSALEHVTLSPETVAAVKAWQDSRDAYVAAEDYGTPEFRARRDEMHVAANLALLHLGMDRARAR